MKSIMATFIPALAMYCNAVGATSINPNGITFPDGSVQVSASKPNLPGNMVWVSATDGDYSNPVDALNNLIDWCQRTMTARECVILLAPETFEIGNSTLRLMSNTHIIGTDKQLSVISGNPDGPLLKVADFSGWTVSNVVISKLGIKHSGGGDVAVGISHEYPKNVKIEQLAIEVSGGHNSNIGIRGDSCSYQYSDHLTVTDTFIDVSGGSDSYGVHACAFEESKYDNIHVNAHDAITNTAFDFSAWSTINVENSTFTSSNGQHVVGLHSTQLSSIKVTSSSIKVSNGTNSVMGTKIEGSNIDIVNSRITSVNEGYAVGIYVWSSSGKSLITNSNINVTGSSGIGLSLGSGETKISHASITSTHASVKASSGTVSFLSHNDLTNAVEKRGGTIECVATVIGTNFISQGCEPPTI